MSAAIAYNITLAHTAADASESGPSWGLSIGSAATNTSSEAEQQQQSDKKIPTVAAQQMSHYGNHQQMCLLSLT